MEFKRFTYRIPSTIEEQNKPLSHFVLFQKSNYTSFPTFQSIKIKHDNCEIKFNIYKCEVIETQNKVLELFHNSYPEEKFEVNQFPHHQKELLTFSKEQLKF